ncbi:MAG: hypothetical protein CBC55_02590 [Gammaproteobacteria bacterium TMED95]|uniref:Uncharacterized protein n=1 Tax=Alteromonas mediterranea TaxID=314275 RepID=A0AAC9JEC8_9ALTE|nr:hypothetical protein [Alteromonas mediterranea]APD92004.1 hypothetical protein BM524_18965 [Alteromonas mediterranea]APD99858.1 hypothetical protein BM525_19160 [Alteromonas mediterranea]OUV22947.1 MAG: hypothetical protein CBC55_02590 [Gammaproteobacteria bacterium TMED95]|tara:strand:+ start:6265 stop:6708 length:444 start_codon:yes stop_codon:yes gene_type:complete
MFTVGDIFQSKSALVKCLSTARYDEATESIIIDEKALRPQALDNDNAGKREPVFSDAVKKGYADLRNTDPSRALSLWEITDVKADGAGCGDSHNVSGRNSAWTRYTCTAKRVNIDGSPHVSGETLSFSNAGLFTVKDYTAVRLPNTC